MMKYCFHILLMGLALNLAAQNAQFTASVNKNKVGLNESFQISFAINKGSKNFQAPSFKDFFVLSGPNQSSSVQIINGNYSQSITYSYTLKPKSIGKFTIGAAFIVVNGNKISSNSITIEAVKSQTPSQSQQQSIRQGDQDINKQIGDNLFLKAVVDKTNVYQGEQVVITYKLYTRVSITNYGYSKLPKYSGFWSQDIEIPGQISLKTENLNGVNYNVGVLKKSILFPQKSGKLAIDPMELECIVRVKTQQQRRSIWDDFFGGSKEVKYNVKSNAIKINVKPLPQANKPSNFEGAIGKFSVDASLDNTETKANEAVTLKIKISGKGNLKLIEVPVLNLSKDIEIYDPKISDNLSVSSAGMSGSRVFEYLLIPRYKGEFKIPSIPFSYFDLTKKDYISLTTPAFILKVTEGAEAPTTGITGVGKEAIQFIGKDIRYIKTEKPVIKKIGEYFFSSLPYFILLSFPFLAFAGMVLYKRKYDKLSSNKSLLARRKANKIAKKHLSSAKKYLKENNKAAFYEATSKALWGYMSDKLNIQIADLNKEKIKDILSGKKVEHTLSDGVINTLDNCEFARFAPGKNSTEMEKVYINTVKLISKLEEKI